MWWKQLELFTNLENVTGIANFAEATGFSVPLSLILFSPVVVLLHSCG